MALSLTGAKIIAMFGQMAVLTFFCLLPIKLAGYVMSKGEKGQIFLSCCRCFGGGALLGSFMLHMTPEIRYLLEQSLLFPYGISYPVPEAIAGAAFFAFLFLEWGVNSCDSKAAKDVEDESIREPGDGGDQIRAWFGDTEHNPRQTPPYALRPIEPPNDEVQGSSNARVTENVGTTESGTSAEETGNTNPAYDSENRNQNSNNSYPEVVMRHPKPPSSTMQHLSAPVHATQRTTNRQSYLGGRPLQTDQSGNPLRAHSYHSGRLSRFVPSTATAATAALPGGTVSPHQAATPSAADRSLILLIALSADGLFQGMAVGLQRTNAAVWSLFIAVVSHEFVVAFCLGLELVRSKPTKTVVISALIYGATPAVGTAIGIAIYATTPDTGDPTDGYLLNGILQSIATGVFLYVAFVGILGEELTSHPTMWALLSVVAGYLLMAGLAALHGHGYEGEEGPPDIPDD